jgi:hypothetical protein
MLLEQGRRYSYQGRLATDFTHMDRTTVAKSIRDAFQGVERDEECTLHQAELPDHIGDRDIAESDWQEAKNKDQQTDWRDVPAGFLDECEAALSHASVRCWRFYLPAYMSRALQLLDVSIWKTCLPGSVIFHLTFGGERDSLAARRFERYEALSFQQKNAVRSFLEYVRNYPTEVKSYRDDAETALRNYWALDERDRLQGPNLTGS